MLTANYPVASEIAQHVHERTNRRVRNLTVELRPGRVVLLGKRYRSTSSN